MNSNRSQGWILGEDSQGRNTVHIVGSAPGAQVSHYSYRMEKLYMFAVCFEQIESSNDCTWGEVGSGKLVRK